MHDMDACLFAKARTSSYLCWYAFVCAVLWKPPEVGIALRIFRLGLYGTSSGTWSLVPRGQHGMVQGR